MNMSIIAASRLRGVFEANTFIGDASSSLNTASDLASRTTLSVSDIKNFQKIGNNVSCYIGVNYEINDLAFGFATIDRRVKYFIDLDGFCVDTNRGFSVDDGEVSFLEFFFANNADVGNNCFENGFNLRYLVSDSISNLGNTVGNDSVFRGTGGRIDKAIAYYPSFLQTVNGGNPDGDIQVLTDVQGSQVVYKNSTNYDKPTAPTISTNTIGGTYVELNVSQPTHVNTLKYALVFVNGFFQNIIDINTTPFVVGGLNENSLNTFKVIIADEYFNVSPFSNTLNVTTTTIDTAALFQNAVAYYKLDETSGNAIDVVNGYNGTLFGGVTQGISGKINTAYSFDGVDGYIDIPDLDDKIATNDFTISCWFKSTQTSTFRLIQNRGNALLGTKKGVMIRYESAFNDYSTTGVDNGSGFLGFDDIDWNENDGNWHLLSLRFKNNEGRLALFIDGIKVSEKTDSNFANINYNQESFEIGRSSGGNQYFNGDMDEVSIVLEALTDGELSDLYNNGSGTTI